MVKVIFTAQIATYGLELYLTLKVIFIAPSAKNQLMEN